MGDLKLPEINYVILAGNLTKDPVARHTSNGTAVVNFTLASNRKYRDSNHHWQEDVCYVGIVAWNKLAESCHNRLKKGDAVLVEGELQSRAWKSEDGSTRNVVEIKARRIQFLTKKPAAGSTAAGDVTASPLEEEPASIEDDTFDKFLTQEEKQILKGEQ